MCVLYIYMYFMLFVKKPEAETIIIILYSNNVYMSRNVNYIISIFD